MNYSSYPSYKDVETNWLKVVPKNWEILPLKRIANVSLSNIDKHTVKGQQPVYLCNYVDVYRNEKINKNLSFMRASATTEQIRRLTLKKGDVIITKDSESPDDIGVPALVDGELTEVVCGYHLAIMRPIQERAVGVYLHRALQSSFVRAQFSISAVGLTRYGIGKYAIENTLIPVPPIVEQIAIANIIDDETIHIDTLIAKQQALIETLQEKRQALISHAVTKGLNPDAPMKDSGVEWLGEIPAHWESTQLRHYIRSIEQGVTFDSENRIAEDHEWAVLKSGCTNRGVFQPQEHKALTPNSQPDAQYEIKPGDVLMSRASGSIDLIGSVAIVGQTRPRLLMSDKVFRLIPGKQLTAAYLNLIMNSRPLRLQIERAINGAEGLANNITKQSIRSLVITIPPIDEQKQIVRVVEAELKKLDATQEKCLKAIGLLQDRRVSLISAAVTGKIDVRNLVKAEI